MLSQYIPFHHHDHISKYQCSFYYLVYAYTKFCWRENNSFILSAQPSYLYSLLLILYNASQFDMISQSLLFGFQVFFCSSWLLLMFLCNLKTPTVLSCHFGRFFALRGDILRQNVSQLVFLQSVTNESFSIKIQ